jgi:hypothetical protein
MLLGFLMVGGLFLAGCSPQAQTDMKEAGQSAAKAAASASDAAGEVAGTAAETVKDAAAEAVEGAQASLADMASKAAEAVKGFEGGPELLSKITEFFGSAGKTLQGVTDAESAKLALPTIEQLSGQADELTKSLAGLPDGAKVAVTGVLEKGLAELKALVEKVLALPGVDSVLKPAVSGLLDKLKTVAGTKE